MTPTLIRRALSYLLIPAAPLGLAHRSLTALKELGRAQIASANCSALPPNALPPHSGTSHTRSIQCVQLHRRAKRNTRERGDNYLEIRALGVAKAVNAICIKSKDYAVKTSRFEQKTISRNMLIFTNHNQ
ncbi:hypothetical protein CDAR_527771 [Caerostris darwini]|uniref:Secreted protein n=1 Tax=Caerostris darwini TaxID=1538125 RepID=A0AAV4RBZ3_9ARAC|nr:hypothetical protein CDAR_527771 [Caerostris darwini]